jgi:hypothetical protein
LTHASLEDCLWGLVGAYEEKLGFYDTLYFLRIRTLEMKICSGPSVWMGMVEKNMSISSFFVDPHQLKFDLMRQKAQREYTL